MGCIAIRGKPFSDTPSLQPPCYRCAAPVPPLLPPAAACLACRQPIVFAGHSFEPLPLVEFVLDVDISDEEALALIR